jgi:hypothetical protein
MICLSFSSHSLFFCFSCIYISCVARWLTFTLWEFVIVTSNLKIFSSILKLTSWNFVTLAVPKSSSKYSLFLYSSNLHILISSHNSFISDWICCSFCQGRTQCILHLFSLLSCTRIDIWSSWLHSKYWYEETATFFLHFHTHWIESHWYNIEWVCTHALIVCVLLCFCVHHQIYGLLVVFSQSCWWDNRFLLERTASINSSKSSKYTSLHTQIKLFISCKSKRPDLDLSIISRENL